MASSTRAGVAVAVEPAAAPVTDAGGAVASGVVTSPLQGECRDRAAADATPDPWQAQGFRVRRRRTAEMHAGNGVSVQGRAL